jgi:enterobactin synthetase component F
LSGAQLGVWFAHQLDPAAGRHITAEFVDVTGPTDPDSLAAAIHTVLDATTALHVSFVTRDGLPRQIPDRPVDWWPEIVDLRDRPEPHADALARMRAELGRPIDLTRDPLFHTMLCRIGEQRFLWYLRVHGIALDSYGFDLVRHAVAAEYAQPGTHPSHDACRAGFTEFLLAEAAQRDSPAFARDRDHWLRAFADRPVLSGLTTDGRPSTDGPAGVRFHRHTAHLPVELLAGTRRVAEASGALWSAVLVAAAATQIRLHTGTPDVLVRLPAANRTTRLAGQVPTMVATMLPLRLSVPGDIDTTGLVRLVSGEILKALRHQAYGIDDLRRDLGVVNSDLLTTGTAVNITAFDRPLLFDGARASVCSLANGPVPDLSLTVYGAEADGRRRVDLDANPERYRAERAARYWDEFRWVLDRMTADPHAPLVASAHRAAPARGRVTPVAPTLLGALREALTRDPTAAALSAVDGSLSYGELNERVNRRAHSLIRAGIGTEQIVAVLLPRTLDLVITLLAVLRSGAVYLPVDPAYPAAHVDHLLATAKPVRVITTSVHTGLLPAGVPVTVLDDPATTAAEVLLPASEPTDADRVRPLTATNAAYVMFTSGSTGRPKAVVVEHRSLANLYESLRHAVYEPAQRRAGRRLRVAHLASASFDASWAQLLWLVAGHAVELVTGEVRGDPAALVELVRANGIDVLPTTPAHARQLLPAGLLADGVPRPGTVCLGGEAVGPQLWQTLRDTAGTEGVNLYGPTECTGDTTIGHTADTSFPALGRPVDNAALLVLDEALRPVPDGATGELYVAGAGVARGYLGRAALTAERFLPSPSGPPGGRMYHTGDVVRRTPDGDLVFVGRADDQVKIRGHRVEPAEVEYALRGHPEVADAAVLGVPDRSGDLTLVGYVVPAVGHLLTGRDIVEYAAGVLPAHEVPSLVVVVDGLPLTARGKLDRNALPVPRPETLGGRAPAGARQQWLCGLFTDLLAAPEVTVDDDFFALGGHSLLAARLLNRIEERTGVRLAMRVVFDGPTVAELDAAIEAKVGQ